MASLYPSVKDGMEDEAEKRLVGVLEERRARASTGGVHWDASVEGETPPLRQISAEGINVFDPNETTTKAERRDDDEPPSKKSGGGISLLAKKIRNLKLQGKLSDNHNMSPLETTTTTTSQRALDHVKEEMDKQQKPTRGSGMFYRIGGVDDSDLGLSEFYRTSIVGKDNLFGTGLAVGQSDESASSTVSESEFIEVTNDETLPLTGTQESLYGSTERDQALRRKREARQKQRKKLVKSFRKMACRPAILLSSFFHYVVTSWFVRLGLPCLIAAFVLFYYMGNPTFDVMDKATASWWLLFACRQTLTLELALISEFLIIDCLALRSRWVHKVIGPLLTLVLLSAKGWPFITFSWACWDLFILQGDGAFEMNWLFFTGMPIFSPMNKGGRILNTKLYLRILIAMLIAAVATAIKRTVVGLYLGRKSFVYYKPRLEKLLSDIVLITEVAELASEAEVIAAMTLEGNTSVNEALTEKKREGMLKDTKWKSLKTFKADQMGEKSLLSEHSSVDDDENSGMSDDLNDDESAFSDNGRSADRRRSELSSGARRIKFLLDRWEEPRSRHDLTSEASISDILKFRKALSYMDEKYPFSVLFGPVSTRDECIKSAQRTYRRLMNLESAGSDSLSFDILGLLAFDADGVEDESKLLALRTMFRPGRFNEITLFAFVQACDYLYKRLRYFRASVGNASVIDRVLEQVIDVIFYFVLVLLVLSVLNFNPWPLLVSVSTLLVSFAFAIGPSLSRYIEGMLMIVVRRPYDLGDRILITNPELLNEDGVKYSWFVEDISVFSTTLRFGTSSEVATVDNGSIAKSRIVNYNRSPNAVISLKLRFNMATEDKLVIFREAVEGFVKDRPRIWDQIIFFRCEDIDKDLEKVEFNLRLRHIKAWQDASSILLNRSELYTFCFEVAERLDLNFDARPRRFYVTNTFAPAEIEGDGTGAGVTKEESPASESAAAKSLLAMLKGSKS